MGNKKLMLGSLFDGSGGFPLGGILAGIEPRWASEIEPFCVSVTTKRLPQVRHLGDIKTIDGGKIEPVDIVTSPPDWCANLGTEKPTEEEMTFWREVSETHRKATGAANKPRTDAQIRKWLATPHSDSAEYRMWGNGLCVSIAWFVLAGIAYYAAQK